MPTERAAAQLAELPSECDLAALGLAREQVLAVQTVHRRRVNVVYRLICRNRSYVLKWIVWPERSAERLAYPLLADLGVPRLWYRIAGNAILMEDLGASEVWRLAR